MATERCPQCGRGLRDGACTNDDCGYVPGPTLRLVKQPVHHRAPAPDHPAVTTKTRPRDRWEPPTAQDRAVGIPWIDRCRQTLAAHTPPNPGVADHLAEVARTTASAKARAVALEVAAELEEAR